jgi:hypothetical protein
MVAPVAAVGGKALAGLVGRIALRSAARGVAGMAARRVARGGVRKGAVSRFARMKGRQLLKNNKTLLMSRLLGSGDDDSVSSSTEASESYSPARDSGGGQPLSRQRGGPRAGITGSGSSGLDVILPQKTQAPEYRNETNASLSTIAEQVKSIVAATKKLLVSSETQENILTENAVKSERAISESILETDDATMVEGADIGGESIEALEPEVDRLIRAIRNLKEQIENGQVGSEGDGDSGEADSGKGDSGGMSLGKKVALAAGAGVLAVGTAVNAGRGIGDLITRGTTSAVQAGREAFSPTEKAPATPNDYGKSTSKVSNILGMQANKAKENNSAAGLEGTSLKGKISNVAKPIVAKSVEAAGLEGLTISPDKGGGIGAALKNLLSGDVAGAGVDNASGMDNVVRALPSLIDTISRDVYYGVYGIHPEQDSIAGERLPVVKNTVKELVQQQLQRAVVAKDEKEIKAESKPTPTPSMEAKSLEQSPAAPQVSGAPSATPAPATDTGGGDAAPAGGSAPSPAMEAADPPSAGGAAGGATPEPPADDMNISPDVASGAGGGSAAPVAATGFGAAIASASEQSEMMSAETLLTNVPSRITGVSYMSTSKPYASGMGNVPEPTYLGAGDLAKSIYFGAVAGAMA